MPNNTQELERKVLDLEDKISRLELSLSGSGQIVQYGKRLGIDRSINISEILKRIDNVPSGDIVSNSSYLSLIDTENSFASAAGKVLQVNADENAVVFDDKKDYWVEDPVNGLLYPKTLSHKVGINTNTPAAQLAVNGGVNIGADADPGDNNLHIVGELGVNTSASNIGRLQAESTSYPVGLFVRNTAVTNATGAPVQFFHLTSANMVNGFGTRVGFAIGDAGAPTPFDIGYIGFIRNGNDTTGQFQIWVRDTGADNLRYTMDKDGNIRTYGTIGIGVTPTSDKIKVVPTDNQNILNVNNTVYWKWRKSAGSLYGFNIVGGGVDESLFLVAEEANYYQCMYFGDGDPAYNIWGLSSKASDDPSWTSRIVVNQNGNVGINNNNPQYALDIDGDIHLPEGKKIYFDSTDTSIYANTDDPEDLVIEADADVLLQADNLVVTDTFIRAATTIYRRYYHLAIAAFDPGASGATWQSGDANQLCGYQLNADTEELEFSTDTHSDWDAASDLSIEIKFSINAAGGSPGDTVDWQLIVYIKGAGDVATKSQTLTESTVIDDDAQFTKYTQVFTIDHDHGTDPVDVSDDICFILTCEATGDVTDVRVTGGSFFYNTTHIGIESGDT